MSGSVHTNFVEYLVSGWHSTLKCLNDVLMLLNNKMVIIKQGKQLNIAMGTL